MNCVSRHWPPGCFAPLPPQASPHVCGRGSGVLGGVRLPQEAGAREREPRPWPPPSPSAEAAAATAAGAPPRAAATSSARASAALTTPPSAEAAAATAAGAPALAAANSGARAGSRLRPGPARLADLTPPSPAGKTAAALRTLLAGARRWRTKTVSSPCPSAPRQLSTPPPATGAARVGAEVSRRGGQSTPWPPRATSAAEKRCEITCCQCTRCIRKMLAQKCAYVGGMQECNLLCLARL